MTDFISVKISFFTTLKTSYLHVLTETNKKNQSNLKEIGWR